jgi:hypothetical protein
MTTYSRINVVKPTDEQDFDDVWMYQFTTSSLAWEFMRTCDEAGWSSGYPSLKVNDSGYYTVQTMRRGWSA